MADNPTYEELELRVKELEQDALEHKQATEALKESEERFRLVFERSNDVMLVHQVGKIKDVNRMACEVTGYTREQLLAMSVLDLFPKEYQPEIKSRLKKNVQAGATLFETKWKRADGKLIDVEVSSSEFNPKEGTRVGITRDITDRKQAEEALRESEAFNSSLLEYSPNPIMVTNQDTSIKYVNPMFEELTGYTSKEIIGKNAPFPWWIDDPRSGDLSERKEKILTDHRGVEKLFGKKNGELFWVEISNKPITQNGELKYIVANWVDITERKQAEEDKKRLEAQLQQAQKLESIGTLAGGIAHDFNNVLSPILIHSEMATMELAPDSPVQHNLKEIFKAGERARDMVKQILAFGRQKQQEKIAVKMGSILKEVLKLLRSTIPTTIDIRHTIDAEVDTIFADPTQIHQIIMNLCTNAFHAMREKGGVLEIKLDDLYLDLKAVSQFTDLNPGSYLRLTVADTGHGIAPAIIDNIFDPYFTTKDVGEGTGMGLSVAHGIVTSHGGDIKVESEPGKGTTFQILLPKFETDTSPVAQPSVQLLRGTERVLFVDDERTAVDAFQPMLESLGYNVTARTSSIEALEAFRNNPDAFDLVISDMTMPNMTGKDLAKALMSIRSDIPIILCTGFSEQIDENEAREMGISAFVMKPIVMKEMAHRIREVLDKKQN